MGFTMPQEAAWGKKRFSKAALPIPFTLAYCEQNMQNEKETRSLIFRKKMKTPRAAAAAGIIFSLLLSATIILLHLGLPETLEQPARHALQTGNIMLALHLVPFSGISFIWFMGVLRDRLGENEDRFFTTVFWSSGILFLATFFVSASVAGATANLLIGQGVQNSADIYVLGRTISSQILNIFSLRMAAVFILSTATLGLRSGFIPKWASATGFVFALLLLVSTRFVDWLPLAFPCWIFIISVYILVKNFRPAQQK